MTMLRGTNFGGDLDDLVAHYVQIVRDGPSGDDPDISDDALASMLSDYARVQYALLLWYIIGAQGFSGGQRLTPEWIANEGRRVCEAAIAAKLRVIWFDCCNEPNNVGPEAYAALVNALCDAVTPYRHQIGIEISCCSVGRLNFDNLRWVERVLGVGIPKYALLSPHDYPYHMNPLEPEPGFHSVEAMVDTWKKLGHRLVIGEEGYWNSTSDTGGGLSAGEAMRRLKIRVDLLGENGVEAVTTYQHRDDPDQPDSSDVHRMGLKERIDGVWRWKESATDIFHPFDHAPAEPQGLPVTPDTGTNEPNLEMSEGSMKTGLLYLSKVTGIDPTDPDFAVYADRDEIRGWEEVELIPKGGGRFAGRYMWTNRLLGITDDGRLVSRPVDAPDETTVLYATQQPDGSAFIYRIVTIDGQPSIPKVLTIQEVV